MHPRVRFPQKRDKKAEERTKPPRPHVTIPPPPPTSPPPMRESPTPEPSPTKSEREAYAEIVADLQAAPAATSALKSSGKRHVQPIPVAIPKPPPHVDYRPSTKVSKPIRFYYILFYLLPDLWVYHRGIKENIGSDILVKGAFKCN